MISRLWAETAAAVATGAYGLVIVSGALDFGIGWDSSGPQPGAFPFYAGLLVALASLGTLVLTWSRRLSGAGASLSETLLDRDQAWRVAGFLLPMAAFVLLSVTLGMYAATILYLVFAMRFHGGYAWVASLATALVSAAFFYLALEKFFQIGLLKGPIEPLIGL